ncbi:zinc finger protein 271-like [Arapaima gigas]
MFTELGALLRLGACESRASNKLEEKEMDVGSFGGATLSVPDCSTNASLLAKVGDPASLQQEQQSSENLVSVGLLKCEECGRGFAEITNLLRHQQRDHALRKPHRCPTCGQSFVLLSSLHLHRRVHTAARYKRSIHRSLHVKLPQLHTALRDRREGRLFGRQPNLQDGGPYSCAPCGRDFSHKAALLHHQQAGCQSPGKPQMQLSPPSSATQDTVLVSQSEPSAVDPVFLESQVLLANTGPTTLQGPMNSCLSSAASSSPPHVSPPPSPTRPHFCSLCHRTFRSQVGLSSHQRLSHPEEWKLAQVTYWKQGGKKFPCPSCDKVFCHAASLYQHRRRCFDRHPNGVAGDLAGHKGQVFPCRSCDMVFSQTSSLLLHRKEKHSRPVRPQDRGRIQVVLPKRRAIVHPCPFCSKVFSHHLGRWAHIRSHHAQQQLQRKRCHSTNQHKADKQEVGKKLFRCSQCSKIYRNRRSLLKHCSTHAEGSMTLGTMRRRPGRPKSKRGKEESQEEEEYPCPSCEEVFSHLSSLREHQLVHRPTETLRSCSVCQHTIGSSRGVELHPSRARVYHCGPCQRTFRLLQVFLQHCQTHLVPLGDGSTAGDLGAEGRGITP